MFGMSDSLIGGLMVYDFFHRDEQALRGLLLEVNNWLIFGLTFPLLYVTIPYIRSTTPPISNYNYFYCNGANAKLFKTRLL